MFFIHGAAKISIKDYDPFMYKCPFCGIKDATTITIYSKYYHVYFVPLFPYDKTAMANCSNCETLRSEEKFGPILISEFNEEVKKVKHPLYTYTILALFIFIVVMVMIAGS